MKAFIIKLVRLLLLFVGFFLIIGFYLEYQFEKDNSDKFIWLRNKENNNFDYAFIGSSRTLNMIDINLIDSVLSKKGINLGMGGADFRTLYMILYTFLEIQNNKIGELYIQVDPFMLYKDSVYNKPMYDHYFYSYVNDENIYNSINHNNTSFVYRLFPIFKYAEFNSVYNLTHFIRSFSKVSKWDNSKGSSLIYSQLPFNPDANPDKTNHKKYLKFDNEDKAYLLKIMDLCSKFKVKTFFYGAPIYNYEKNFKFLYPNFSGDMTLLSNKYRVEYINFMGQDYDKSFFKDMTHMNYKGSINFTELLIKARTHNNVYKK